MAIVAYMRCSGMRGTAIRKVVRRLMVEEQLVVSRNRRRRYSSYFLQESLAVTGGGLLRWKSCELVSQYTSRRRTG